jgi:hypothetical protein
VQVREDKESYIRGRGFIVKLGIIILYKLSDALLGHLLEFLQFLH